MSTGWIIAIVITVILLGALVGLTIWGRKMQKKQEESQTQIREGAQLVSMLVIDKKRMKLTEAGFPQIVIDQTPKYLRRSKVPVVKAKVGPKVASFMCDDKAFDLIPVKREAKVLINGIYIIEVKSARGGLEAPAEKKTFKQKISARIDKLNKKQKQLEAEEAAAKKNKKK